jgi:trehalose-6-phosphate synthase
LPLTPDQVSSFYHITSKEAFWPILHSFKERYNYDPVDWPTFREVNWAFAEAAAAEAASGAVSGYTTTISGWCRGISARCGLT